MKHANNIDLGHGNVKSLMIRLSLPTIASQIVNMLYNLVDRIYIGHMEPVETVGTLALTGVGVCLPIILIISAFAALLASGGAPRASIQEGRGDIEGAEQIMGNCFTLLLIASLLLTVFLQMFAEPLLLMFGASENTIVYSLKYMRIYSLGTLFVQLTLGMNAFITAQGFTVTSMKTVMIGAGLNIILDPIFIFLFHMGVQGAALATIISQAVSALWVLRFLRGSNTKWKLRRKNLRPYAKVTLPCVALGSASFVMQSTESLIAVCFNSSLLKYGGDVAVGSMTVLTGIMQLVLMPVQGLGQGAQPLISFNYGARNAQRVREAFRCLLVFSLSCTLIFCTVIQIIPRPFVMLFNNNPELVDYAVWALRIYSFGLSIFGIQMACQQTFVSLGNSKTSLFLAVWRKIILLIPLIYILPPFFENKTFAVFLAEPIADILAVITTAILFSMQFKKSMALLESPEI